MYALLDAPAVCHDLAQLPGGAAVAGALHRALRLTPPDLHTLAAGFSDDVARQAAWDELEAACGRRARSAESRAALDDVLAIPPDDTHRARAAARRLARSTYGSLPDVVSLVRSDILDWTWQRGDDLRLQIAPHAVAVVCDGVAACYGGTSISPGAFRRLRQPWTSALDAIDTSRPRGAALTEFGPGTAAVRRIAATLAASGPRHFTALDCALGDARTSGLDWARRMHSATRAVEITGRTRAAAAAQFSVVRALASAALPAPGAALAISAAVQAAVVADLLDAATYDALVAPWRRVFPGTPVG